MGRMISDGTIGVVRKSLGGLDCGTYKDAEDLIGEIMFELTAEKMQSLATKRLQRDLDEAAEEARRVGPAIYHDEEDGRYYYRLTEGSEWIVFGSCASDDDAFGPEFYDKELPKLKTLTGVDVHGWFIHGIE